MSLCGVLVAISLVPLAAYLFLGFAIVCDDYLMPSLTHVCEHLRIRKSVGATTLVAFGASAPELMISCIGVSSDETRVTIPAMVAVGTLTFGAVPGILILTSRHRKESVEAFPVLRDALFFLVALFLVSFFMKRHAHLDALAGSVLTLFYVAYVAVVVLFASDDDDDEDDGAGIKRIDDVSPLLPKERTRLHAALRRPYECLTAATIRGGPMCRFACVLVWLGILAYLAILATEFIAEMGGASYATSGVVFLALGSQLPDFIAAVNLASHGETTDGLAQAGGSQVLNMSLGLGFPVLIYSLVTDSGIKTDNTDDILDLGLLCAAMVVVYLVVVLVLARSPQTSPGGEEDQGTRRRVVTKTHAVVLVGVCATLYTLSVLVSEYRVYFLT